MENQKSLEEMARKATPVFQQLAAIGQRLAVAFQPFVNLLALMSEHLASVIPQTAGQATAAIMAVAGSLGMAYVAAKRWIMNKIKARMETLNLNNSLRANVLELNRVALGWRRVGDYSAQAMNKQGAAMVRLGQASAAARAQQQGGVATPAGPGPGFVAGAPAGRPGSGGMGARGIGGMIAGMVAMKVAPMIGRALTDDRKAQRQVSGVVGGAASGAMTGAMIGSMFTPAGAAIGAGVGGLIGGVAGYTTAHRGIYGGPVPGPRGKERMVKAQGGEMVVQPEQLAALARGGSNPRLDQNVEGLRETVGTLSSQINNLGSVVQNLLSMGKEKNDLYVTVQIPGLDPITQGVVNELENNPNYGLAV